MPEPLLDVRGVTLQYKTKDHLVTATYRVSFQVFRSDRFVILGPSGCGKSTLLKAVGGYIEPVEGEIRLGGEVIRKPGPDRVMVFQEFDQLLPWKTVKRNVMFALTASRKLSGKKAEEKALQYIEKVNLAQSANSFPHTLSATMGGNALHRAVRYPLDSGGSADRKSDSAAIAASGTGEGGAEQHRPR